MEKMIFEIKDRDTAGRICKLTTKHGSILTPNLMPVINPNKMHITPKEMNKLFGTDVFITNSYIINNDKKLRKKALDLGVHKLIDFDGTIMTDSGTFQSYVYGDVNVDPIEIVEFQREIGSDIGTILDVFGKPDQTRKEALLCINETLRRADISIKKKGNMPLACTVQGAVYPELRERCAKKLSEMDSDFFPIGGVVPLMENQRYDDLVKIIISSKKGLDPSKPVHLFGAGHPLIFPLAVALGCDLFDSSAYVKYANDDRLLFHWGTERLDELFELPCNCPICSKYNISELKKLEKEKRISEISKHNLYVSFTEIKKIRNAISKGCLWELVERRAYSNPYLFDALKILRLKENKIYLEKFEPISKNRAIFYTGHNTIHRPLVFRCHKRLLSRHKPASKITIVFPEGNKPYSTNYKDEIKKIFEKNNKLSIVIDSQLGPVPLELDEMYPYAQSIFPNIIDNETEDFLTNIFEIFTKDKKLICWKGNETLRQIKKIKNEKSNFDTTRISAVADMQFGKGAGKTLFNDTIKIVKSKKTGKIRNIYREDDHILSMRASDGFFTLKINGAKILHKLFKYPRLRVVISGESVPFVKEGKSVFAKFVKECDPELRPFDECLVVDEKDNLVGIGRCVLNRDEMIAFRYGVAVKTR
jgi:7-cyano-7-deazaguanine tRNA-ribosyltransferase